MNLSFVTSTTSSGQSVTGPAAIQAGDLLILVDLSVNSPLLGSSVPSGFTEINTVDDRFNVRITNSYKIADGAEASASIVGMPGSIEAGKILLVFRGDEDIADVIVGFTAQEATGGDPSLQTVTSGSGTPPLIVGAVYWSNNAISPRTFSPAADGEIPQSSKFLAKYKIYNSSPADVSVDMGDHGFNILMSFYVEAAVSSGFSGIYLGDTQINAIKLGSDDVKAVYLGSTKVFEKA